MLYPTMPPTYELPVTAPVLLQPLIALFSARPTMPLTYELPFWGRNSAAKQCFRHRHQQRLL